VKRYRVEAQAQGSTTWEAIYYTDSLPVAKRYAAAVLKVAEVRATRVVNQATGQVTA
jgi:hypothetical protein